MNKLVISLGSNCGDRTKNVREAANWIARLLQDTRCSDIYETPEIHGIGDPYMNAVIIGESSDDYDALNSSFKQYEILAGRDAGARSRGEVPIDIDIVIWNDNLLRNSDYSANFFQIGYLALIK